MRVAFDHGRDRATEMSDSPGPAFWTAFVLLVLVAGWMLTGGEHLGLLLAGAMGVAVAAYSVRLLIRILNGERRAKYTAVLLLLGVVLGYPLSFLLLVFTRSEEHTSELQSHV